MTEEEKRRAEAESWRAWQTAWGNTESGAHAHGWEHGYRAGTAQVERLKTALEEVRRYALCVVGASEAYGETKSAHLWQEVADTADAALYPPGESNAATLG